MDIDKQSLYEAACRIARAGGDHTLQYFKRSLEVEQKADLTPVTIADRETESLMREMITRDFPSHKIVGEEFGITNPDSPVSWVLDPIDGTKSFIHGIGMYTTLLGVLVDNQPIIGIIYAPAMDEFCSACSGEGTLLNGKAVTVRRSEGLSQSTLLTTDMAELARQGCLDAWTRLCEPGSLQRTWGDAYGHMMVACGRADLMFDPILNIWDAAPLLTVVTEAGGCFFDRSGAANIAGGSAISTTPGLRDQVKAILCQAPDGTHA
jgi:myo-inositol-1(or 4)-monophosphatase